MASVRKFIRHPSDIPIKVSEVDDSIEAELGEYDAPHINNVSLGGLAFFSSKAFESSHHLLISIPCINTDMELEGSVLWCKQVKKGFEVGVEFDDPKQVFCLRMIEQVCHIEHYRNEIKRAEGRDLSSEEAATEWISKFAAEFPSFDQPE